MRPELLLLVLPASTEMPLSDMAGLYELRDELRSGGKLAWIEDAMLLIGSAAIAPVAMELIVLIPVIGSGAMPMSGRKPAAAVTLGMLSGPSVVRRLWTNENASASRLCNDPSDGS